MGRWVLVAVLLVLLMAECMSSATQGSTDNDVAHDDDLCVVRLGPDLDS